MTPSTSMDTFREQISQDFRRPKSAARNAATAPYGLRVSVRPVESGRPSLSPPRYGSPLPFGVIRRTSNLEPYLAGVSAITVSASASTAARL